jgi:hypothetical protein
MRVFAAFWPMDNYLGSRDECVHGTERSAKEKADWKLVIYTKDVVASG